MMNRAIIARPISRRPTKKRENRQIIIFLLFSTSVIITHTTANGSIVIRKLDEAQEWTTGKCVKYNGRICQFGISLARGKWMNENGFKVPCCNQEKEATRMFPLLDHLCQWHHSWTKWIKDDKILRKRAMASSLKPLVAPLSSGM